MTNKIKWALDPVHSDVTFRVRHLMISSLKGVFRIFDASIYTEGTDFLTAEVDLWIDTVSIDTGDEKRDEHLKSADFFHVKNYGQITFISNTIEKIEGTDSYEVWGGLTIKEITKNIRLMVELGGFVTDPAGNEKVGFSVTGKINRNDYGLVWNNTLAAGGFVIGEEVHIACELELCNMAQKDLTMQVEHKLEDTIVF